LATSAVYYRTEAGAQELKQRALSLSRAERLILILSDGKADAQTVRAKLPAVSRAAFNQAQRRLVEEKLLIVAGGGGEASPDDAATAEAGLAPATRLLEEADTYVKAIEPLMAASRLEQDFAATRLKSGDPIGSPAAAAPTLQRRGLRFAAPIRRYARGLLVVGILLGLLVAGLVTAVRPLYAELQPQVLSQRLSTAAGVPVTVGSSGFRLFPTPSVVLSDLRFGAGPSVPEALIGIDVMTAAEGLASGAGLGVGTVTVPTLSLTAAQGLRALNLLERLSPALPLSLKVIKINQLQLIDVGSGSDRFAATASRNGPTFNVVEVQSAAGADQLTVKLSSAAGPSGRPGARFELDAGPWLPLIGPALRWTQVSARGRIEDGLLLVENFELSGFGGSVGGAAVAAYDVEWAVAATARVTQLHLPSLLEAIKGTPAGWQAPLSGSGNAAFRIEGRGATLAEARTTSRMRGAAKVFQAELRGINLGLAAVQGTAAGINARGGGVTRFRELSADFEVAADRVALSNILGRAGALTVLGRMDIAPDSALDGRLRVELGGTRVQAPLGVAVGGTVTEPEFKN
jgi:hypothetical protein